jgi:hypothetical protein
LTSRSGGNELGPVARGPIRTLHEIEDAVRGLSPADLSCFREWFLAFEADAWDRQFEEDAATGRLDVFADEALSDLAAGRTTPL